MKKCWRNLSRSIAQFCRMSPLQVVPAGHPHLWCIFHCFPHSIWLVPGDWWSDWEEKKAWLIFSTILFAFHKMFVHHKKDRVSELIPPGTNNLPDFLLLIWNWRPKVVSRKINDEPELANENKSKKQQSWVRLPKESHGLFRPTYFGVTARHRLFSSSRRQFFFQYGWPAGNKALSLMNERKSYNWQTYSLRLAASQHACCQEKRDYNRQKLQHYTSARRKRAARPKEMI